MTEDEFRTAVLSRLDGVDRRMDGMAGQLEAIVARLDDQDRALDQLEGKVDRLHVAVNGSVEASAQALTAITSLSRRVTKLEKPGGA